MIEDWRDIKGYEDKYAVSNIGRIYSYQINGVMSLVKKKDGSMQVGLTKSGKIKFFLVHRLVAANFIRKNLSEKDIVTHKDQKVDNNKFSNLIVMKRAEFYSRQRSQHGNKIAKKPCVRKKFGKKGIKYIGFYYDDNNKQNYVGSYNTQDEALEQTQLKMNT